MHDVVSTRAGRITGLVLTAAVIVVGTALGAAAPASADRPPAGTDRPTEVGTGDAGVQLGPATKFVREPDGSVRQVR